MKYVSTRLNSGELSFENTILQGLAPDGGLYVPEFLPNFTESEIAHMRHLSYEELFFEVTRHFVGSEIDAKSYQEIIKKSYQNFSHTAIAPLKQLSKNEFLLELFHGPTLAFKDFALQFLGNLLDFILSKKDEKIVIIGATSGDTGSAAIHGCTACKNAQIFILHPHNKVSEVQKKQMTTVLDDNVFNIALQGSFDDCQAMVKKMFMSQDFLKGKRMVAVNSINWARIMAQIVYYFYCGLRLGASKNNPVTFSVPTGNFGDIYAGFLAKKMGLMIKKLIIATNENDILTRFINNNDYKKNEMIDTISPSMNIQVSSNFERLLFDIHKEIKIEKKVAQLMQEFEQNGQMKVQQEVLDHIKKTFISYSINDQEAQEAILKTYQKTSETLDPHSAIAVAASKKFMQSNVYEGEFVVNLATAHPAKFPEAVIDAGAPKPTLPSFLQDLMDKKERFEVLENNLDVVKEFISQRV
jgi:threonine synthase